MGMAGADHGTADGVERLAERSSCGVCGAAHRASGAEQFAGTTGAAHKAAGGAEQFVRTAGGAEWSGCASGASVVAIDNKIEQAMDLVKNHLMYAVREEVEILKEQIKELVEKNSQLERENSLLKTLASPEQLEKFQSWLPAEVLSAEEQGGAAAPAQHTRGSAV